MFVGGLPYPDLTPPISSWGDFNVPQCFYPMFGIKPKKIHKGLVGEESDFCALGVLHPSTDSFSFFHPTTISTSTKRPKP